MSEQIPPGDHLARVAGQVVQQVELALAEVKFHAVESGLMGARVQPKAADLKWLGGVLGAVPFRTPQDRPDPGIDLVRPERLDHVIICAGIQRPDDFGLVVTRGDYQHSHRADGTDHAQRLLPAEVGQPKIEEHGIGRRLENLLQRGRCRGCAGDRMAAFRQGTNQRVPDGGIVLYQQQLRHNTTVTGFGNGLKEAGHK